MPPFPPPSSVREPLQKRSRETLERLVNAATELLEERQWHEISIAEIAQRARSSIGSFYARFSDKDALLDLLDERYALDVLALQLELEEKLEREPPGLRPFVELVVSELVSFHRARRGLIRALVLRARTFREPRYEERTRRMNRAVCSMVEDLAERLPEDLGEERGRRAFLAFSFLLSALRDRILFPESLAETPGWAPGDLEEELTRASLAYLRLPGRGAGKSRGENP